MLDEGYGGTTPRYLDIAFPARPPVMPRHTTSVELIAVPGREPTTRAVSHSTTIRGDGVSCIPREQIVHQVGRLVLQLRYHVTVRVHRQADLAVP